jgi:hypothetical protein
MWVVDFGGVLLIEIPMVALEVPFGIQMGVTLVEMCWAFEKNLLKMWYVADF